MDGSLHEALREASDPTMLMRRVTEQAMHLIPMADGASLEIRIDDDTLEYVSTVGTLAPFTGLRIDARHSISGLAAGTGEVVRTGDARTDPRSDPAAVQRTGVISMLAMPLADGADGVAVLKVTSQQPNAFTDEDGVALRSLSDFVRSVLNLASELARVTTLLLASGQSDHSRLQAAHFVAEVMRPGLVNDIVGHRRVREVLAATQLQMVVQPIVDMRTGRVRFAEALARFTTVPERGPDQWFDEAHRVGLGLQLELAAAGEALALLPGLPDDVSLCINVAPIVVRSGALLDLIPPAHRTRVVLEITEHHVMDPLSMAGPIARVREAGVRVAIDDTGTGYASLSALLRIEPDIIKVDRDLVRGIDHDPARRAMAKALVHFAMEDSVAEVIAEGIETEAEAATLVGLGITLGQGYFFGRPAALSQFSAHNAWRIARPLPIVSRDPG